MNPSDPVCAVGDCVTDHGEFSVSTGHRASAQREFATEHGYDFADVSCHRAYIRIFTRQEVYDAYRDWLPSLMDMTRCSIEYGPYGFIYSENNKPVDPALMERLRGPRRVPDDWHPPEQMELAAWTIVDRDHPDAIPVWISEPF